MTRHIFFTAMLVALFSTAAFAQTYIITGSGTSLTATKDGEPVGAAGQPINTVITAIQTDANGADVSIHFLDLEYIGVTGASFSGNWGKITLSGKINHSVTIGAGISIESTADIDRINNSGTLTITGGTISDWISNSGTLTITGGTISTIGGLYDSSINATRYGYVVLGGSPDIIGSITYYTHTYYTDGGLSVITNGDNVFNPGDKQYKLDLGSDYNYNNNAVAVKDGKDFLSNFTLVNTNTGIAPSLDINGNDLVIKLNLIYAVSQNGLSFTITKGNGGQFGTISEAISFIQEAANGAAVSIQFGDGENVLDIGGESARFGYTGGTWGKITLSGKITSSSGNSGTVGIGTGVSIESTADISNNNYGYGIYNSGTLSITGGTVQAYGTTVYNNDTVSISGGTVSNIGNNYVVYSGNKITVSGNAIVTTSINSAGIASTIYGFEIEILGGTISNTGEYGYAVRSNSIVLKGSPKITGNISVPAGKLSITNAFVPGTEIYYIALTGPVATGNVAVVGGANHINNFKLANLGWGLEADDGNLVTKEIPTYTVTFVDQDGKELKTESVNEGFSANPPPTKVGYTLIGWDIDFSNVTSDLTVTGSYIINTYTVTFLDWDGKVLKTELVEHGSAATAPTPTREGYALIGWDIYPDIYTYFTVTSDLTVTAKYIATYTVTFLGWGGTVLKTQIVNEGSEATFNGSLLSKEGYTFTGWDRDIEYSYDVFYNMHYFNNITSNLTITAKYTINTFTVTFLDWDGTELKTEIVEYGSPATAPTVPPREGYVFTGWDYSFNNVTSDITATANYIATYTVTFLDWDGTEIETRTLDRGSVVYPLSTEVLRSFIYGREGYFFTGWDVAFEYVSVVSDLTITAMYTIITYGVSFIFMNSDRQLLVDEQYVEYGSAAIAPTVPEVEGYTFVGWDIDFSNVTSDLTVTALYEETTPILSQIAATNRLITPTQNGITLTAKTNATVAVYNLSGKLINRQSYNAGNHSISFGHLPKGMYIVKASHGSEKEILRVTVR